jgi:NitT/TauT family transport system ATP-binding protein
MNVMMARPTRENAVVAEGAIPTIEIVRATKEFEGTSGKVLALEDASLRVYPNEFICLIGPSGCGKSTLLNLLAELIEPTAGRILINGRPVSEARKTHQVGLVFQDAVLLPWRTAAENIALPLEVLKLSKGEQIKRITEVLELVGLSGFADKFPHELSGGMRQRVGIARALSFDPQILLMDEPFGALDAITRDRMALELLRIWEQRQKTVIFVTHSISEAALLSDRVVMMTARPGRIQTVIENPLPRPRTLHHRDDADFIALSKNLRDLLEGDE